MNITGGTRVIEAGTGSASLTHSFARTVGQDGKVFTYEFHEPRFLEAKAEIELHGIDLNTFITHRDVCEHGFEIEAIPQQFQKNGHINADVVFLDLPSPWTAVTKLDSVVSKTTPVRVCCFSPCIEQVQKTVEALIEWGWIDIEMVEVNGRRWEARKDMVRDVNDAVKRLKDIQSRRGQGLESRKHGALNGQGDATDASDVDADEETKPKDRGFNPFGRGERVREGDHSFQWRNVTKVESEIKSHTSYLTFAVKLPQHIV